MEKNVSTLLFDLGGVLLNLDYNLTIEAFKTLSNQNFESLYSKANQHSLFDRFETGQITPVDFRDHLRAAFENENIPDLEIDQAWNKMLLDFPAERIDLLKELGKKYNLLLFSNTNAIHFKKFREIIGDQHGQPNLLEELFDTTYYSHLLGKRKPHAVSFQKILQLERLEPSDLIFFDDSIQHIEGARSLGIEARHIQDKDIIESCKDLL